VPSPEDLDVIALQSRLRFSEDLKSIKANRDQIKRVRDALAGQLKIVDSLNRANQEMCEHPNKVAYSDPRDSGWDCPDCGA